MLERTTIHAIATPIGPPPGSRPLTGPLSIPLSGPTIGEDDALVEPPTLGDPARDPIGDFEDEGGPDSIDGEEDVQDFI
jgi:hypothetical protein